MNLSLRSLPYLLRILYKTTNTNKPQDITAPSESCQPSLVPRDRHHILPNEIVEDILTMVWLQRYLGDRWLFYRAMLGVSRQWQAIMRHLCLRFVIVESLKDLENYRRIVLMAKDEIPDNAELVELFCRTHVRVDVDAFVQPPMLPACKSLEITQGRIAECRMRRFAKEDYLYFNSWLRIPHLKVVAVFNRFGNFEDVVSGIPPTITHLVLGTPYLDNTRLLAPWSGQWLGHITHLRVCSPRPLVEFVRHVPNLEELTLDLGGPFPTLYYTIVAALKAGIFRKPKKRLILNTGPTEPVCYGLVVKTCKRLGIVLGRRVVYKENEPSGLVVRDNIPTFL